MNTNAKNLTGQKFGKLTAIEPTKQKRDRHIIWKCLCDCGKITYIRSMSFGRIKSCGCLIKENNHERFSLPNGDACRNSLYNNYKRGAIKRNLSFELTKEEFRNLTKQSCYYCGSEPNQEYKQPNTNGNYIYNGIDRTDNTKGYILDNCVPCCGKCNRAKDIMTLEEFYNWIGLIYDKRQRTKSVGCN
jgi:hypothetical protein